MSKTHLLISGLRTASQVSGFHLAAVIILSCAACLIPIELFILEIWPRHGFNSLLLILIPAVIGALIARSLPENYYRLRFFELSGRLYEWVGIRRFKRVVPDGDYLNRLVRQSNPQHRLISSQESLIQFEARTRLAERLHLGALILPVPCIAHAVALKWTGFALWMVLANVAFHAYPILLQRYTRGRILRVVRLRSKNSRA